MKELRPNKDKVIVARAWREDSSQYPIIVEVKVMDLDITREDGTVIPNPFLLERSAAPLKEAIAPNLKSGVMITLEDIRNYGIGEEPKYTPTKIYPNDRGVVCEDAFTAYALCRAAWK